MLTIDKKLLDRAVLKVPNYAIKGLYFEYFSKKLNKSIDYEIDNGYIDIALLKQVNMEPTYFAILELKYISKYEYQKEGEKIVKEKMKEAVSQLEKYKTSPELSSISNLKKWAIVFVNDKCVKNFEI